MFVSTNEKLTSTHDLPFHFDIECAAKGYWYFFVNVFFLYAVWNSVLFLTKSNKKL